MEAIHIWSLISFPNQDRGYLQKFSWDLKTHFMHSEGLFQQLENIQQPMPASSPDPYISNLKATSGLYRKVCLLGDGTKNITFLSERNKNSLNKISKGRSHYSLPELEAPSCNSSYTAHLFQAKSLAKFAGLLGTLSKVPECLSSRHRLSQNPKQAK